jgi:DNA-binding transcriptional MerR regulator
MSARDTPGNDHERGLTVGEVARRAGIAASAVRYYERLGLLPKAPRTGGWRQYPSSVLDRLRLIGIATASGFSLAEVDVLLRALDEGAPASGTLAELAAAKVPELEAALIRTQLLVELMRAASDCRCPSLADCAALAEQAGIGVGPSSRDLR